MSSRGAIWNVGVALSLSLIIGISVARGDAYSYFRVEKGTGEPITYEHFANPYDACHSLVGHDYANDPQTAPTSPVLTASYAPDADLCITYGEVVGYDVHEMSVVPGACPEDERFNFARQMCGEFVNQDDGYDLVMAFYLTTLFGLGVLSGHRMGVR